MRYCQYRCTKATRSLVLPEIAVRKESELSLLKPMLLECDAIVQIWVKDYADWQKVGAPSLSLPRRSSPTRRVCSTLRARP